MLMTWTDERVEQLKKLWSEGLSASRIATELGGVTRNAVIGKVHRLGLSGRVKTTGTQQQRPRRTQKPGQPTRPTAGPVTIGATALKAEPAPRPEPKAEPAPVEDMVVPISERATILTLTESTCKWPIGDPGNSDFHFCGRRSDPGIPYCQHHARIAYQPVSDRRRDKRAAS